MPAGGCSTFGFGVAATGASSSPGLRRRRGATRFWRAARSALIRAAGPGLGDERLGSAPRPSSRPARSAAGCARPPARRPGPSHSASESGPSSRRPGGPPAACSSARRSGSTRPRSVISPVMARSRRTGCPVSRLAMAVAMVTPADGPSLGVAPAGHVDVQRVLLEGAGVDAQLLVARPDVATSRPAPTPSSRRPAGRSG